MALKNLFDMVKADRYTADGREEIIKAQEAETEDKVYQIGEISQKTGLQKTANGWVKPKTGKAPGAKTGPGETPNKGAGIPDFKGMTAEDFDKKLRAEGWTTGGWEGSETHSSAIFKKGGRTIRVNEGQPGKITSIQEISEPAENKPAANVKRNESEAVKNGDKTIYRIKGTQYYFDSPEEAESAILAENRSGKTYAKPSKDENVNNIQEALGFKLDMTSGNSMDEFIKKTGENEYAANVWSFGRDSKGTLINKLSETSSPNAIIKKENGEWKLYHKDRDGKETVVTANGRQDPTRDAAPRVLTGDTRIRVRKA